MNLRESWLTKLEDFRSMSADTDRPNTIVKLAREGMWREMDGVFAKGETITLLMQAGFANGYGQLHGYSAINDSIESARIWAKDKYVKSGKGGTTKPDSSLVRPASCTPSHVQRYVDDVSSSSLPPSAKRQLYVAAYRAWQHPEWTTLVISARAMSAAAGVDKGYVGPNWRKAEKLGFISFNPGVSYEDAALNPGLDPKSSEITLNLDIYPDTPVDNPAVDLTQYANAASNIQGYIKYRRHQHKMEQNLFLKTEDVSTAKFVECNYEKVIRNAAGFIKVRGFKGGR
jgi:hypothetical protein